MGLGIGTQVNAKAYVVFSKTRIPPLTFYEWMNDIILFRFIGEIKDAYPEFRDSLTWFQLDGEGVQIECYKKDHILAMLEARGIIVGKPPGSLTGKSQPCDGFFQGYRCKNHLLNLCLWHQANAVFLFD